MGTVQFMTLFLKALQEDGSLDNLPYEKIEEKDRSFLVEQLTHILEEADRRMSTLDYTDTKKGENTLQEDLKDLKEKSLEQKKLLLI